MALAPDPANPITNDVFDTSPSLTSEFGHYKWDDFQQSLIQTISRWENTPGSQRGDWQYYDHWVAALEKVIADQRLLTAPVAKDAGDHAMDGRLQ